MRLTIATAAALAALSACTDTVHLTLDTPTPVLEVVSTSPTADEQAVDREVVLSAVLSSDIDQ